jgi:hypothetical protein
MERFFIHFPCGHGIGMPGVRLPFCIVFLLHGVLVVSLRFRGVEGVSDKTYMIDVEDTYDSVRNLNVRSISIIYPDSRSLWKQHCETCSSNMATISLQPRAVIRICVHQ